jgi:hypothetical protein
VKAAANTFQMLWRNEPNRHACNMPAAGVDVSAILAFPPDAHDRKSKGHSPSVPQRVPLVLLNLLHRSRMQRTYAENGRDKTEGM